MTHHDFSFGSPATEFSKEGSLIYPPGTQPQGILSMPDVRHPRETRVVRWADEEFLKYFRKKPASDLAPCTRYD